MQTNTTGPDVAGLLAALRELPDTAPAQRRRYRAAAGTHRAAKAMTSGGRWRTRELPRTTFPRRARHLSQPRDAAGRWER